MGYARTLSGLPEVVLPMAPTEALSEVSDLRVVATGAILRKREIGEHGRWKYRLQTDVNDNRLERVAMVSSNNNRYEVGPDDSVPDVTTNRAELRHGPSPQGYRR